MFAFHTLNGKFLYSSDSIDAATAQKTISRSHFLPLPPQGSKISTSLPTHISYFLLQLFQASPITIPSTRKPILVFFSVSNSSSSPHPTFLRLLSHCLSSYTSTLRTWNRYPTSTMRTFHLSRPAALLIVTRDFLLARTS